MKHPILKTLIAIPAVLLATCHFASATDISFTSGEGYSVASLGSNSSWYAYSNANVTNNVIGIVNLATGGRLGIYQDETFDFSVADSAFTSYIDVQWTQGVALASSLDFAEIRYYQNATGTSSSTSRLQLNRAAGAGDNYELQGLGVNVSLSAADLGIDSANSDVLSDVIRISSTLTKTSATTWATSYIVTNETSSSIVTSGTGSSINLGAANDDTTMYSGFQGGFNDTFGDVNILNFGVSAIPEASSFAMLAGLLSFSWVMARRRRQG